MSGYIVYFHSAEKPIHLYAVEFVMEVNTL